LGYSDPKLNYKSANDFIQAGTGPGVDWTPDFIRNMFPKRQSKNVEGPFPREPATLHSFVGSRRGPNFNQRMEAAPPVHNSILLQPSVGAIAHTTSADPPLRWTDVLGRVYELPPSPATDYQPMRVYPTVPSTASNFDRSRPVQRADTFTPGGLGDYVTVTPRRLPVFDYEAEEQASRTQWAQ
jgi:hypothetical protein